MADHKIHASSEKKSASKMSLMDIVEDDEPARVIIIKGETFRLVPLCLVWGMSRRILSRICLA